MVGAFPAFECPGRKALAFTICVGGELPLFSSAPGFYRSTVEVYYGQIAGMCALPWYLEPRPSCRLAAGELQSF